MLREIKRTSSVPTRGEKVLRAAPSIAGVVLLAGAAPTNSFAEDIGRPFLELPVAADGGKFGCRTLLELWWDQVCELDRVTAGSRPVLRVLQDRRRRGTGLFPAVAADQPGLTIECDRAELRGTAGALRDAVVGV
jgi:hypothetical protein